MASMGGRPRRGPHVPQEPRSAAQLRSVQLAQDVGGGQRRGGVARPARGLESSATWFPPPAPQGPEAGARCTQAPF